MECSFENRKRELESELGYRVIYWRRQLLDWKHSCNHSR